MNTEVLNDNPIEFKSKESVALEDAVETFIEAVEEYAKKRDISDEEMKYLVGLISEIYIEEKALHHISNKFRVINKRFNYLFESLIDKKKSEEVPVSVFYYNFKNHLKENERY